MADGLTPARAASSLIFICPCRPNKALDLKSASSFSIGPRGVRFLSEDFMNRPCRLCLAGCALCVIGANWVAMQTSAAKPLRQDAPVKVEGYYCNIKALTPAERARHAVLTGKLLAAKM